MKKLLSIALVVVLLAGIAVSGTMAYLTSEDSDVNVMTLGNVTIKQHEQQLAEDGSLEPFEQAKDFYPGTEVSKIVTVENTGKSDAYFRTLIAFEDLPDSETFGINFPINEAYEWSWSKPEATIVVDGVTYQVYEALYKGVLKAGETSPASLTKVEMAATATNEDMEALGDTYDILVLSQAVQAEGFADARIALDTAFPKGEDNANVETWFAGLKKTVLVENEEELKTALAEGNRVIFGNHIELTTPITVDKSADIDLNGYTLTTVGLDLQAGGYIEDGTVKSGGNTNMTPHLKVSGGTLTMDNVTVDVEHHLNANVYWSEATGMEVANAAAVLNNCNININNKTKAQWVYSYGLSLNNAEVTMNGGSITAACVAGTAANGPTNPNAISAMGACTATLNNVAVDATYYGTTVNGHLTLNTTDTTITSEDIVDNRGGSHTLNYIG